MSLAPVALLLRPLVWLASSLLAYFLLTLALVLGVRALQLVVGRRWRRPPSARQAVLVTGATSGIGLALAKRLHALGYSVVAAYLERAESGHAELSRLQQRQARAGNQLLLLELDVRDQQSVGCAAEELRRELRRRDLQLAALVNNAGLGSLQPFAWLPPSQIRALVETNLLGCMLLTRALLPLLIESKGRILNVSSGLGLVPGQTYVTYGATKCAQIYFTRGLNLELAERRQVKSVAIVPHNLIKNTAICARNAEANRRAWDELRPDERRLYESEFREHAALADELERATERLRASRAPQRASGRLASSLAPLRRALASLRGENQAASLEDSNVIESFVDAIQLRDPPEIMFAGDATYSLLVGSLLLALPACCSNLLSSSVKPSLYR